MLFRSEEFNKDMEKSWKDLIVVPNSWLPEKYHNKKEWEPCDDPTTDYKLYGATLSEIEAIANEGIRSRNEKIAINETKEANVRDYLSQMNRRGSFEYNEDEYRLYNKQLSFCKILGLITEEDLEG